MDFESGVPKEENLHCETLFCSVRTNYYKQFRWISHCVTSCKLHVKYQKVDLYSIVSVQVFLCVQVDLCYV
jgi:hypothetical protein